MIDGVGKDNMPCGAEIGQIEKEGELVPETCDYIIKSNDQNTFTVKRWTFKERQDFYSMIGTFKEPITPGSVTSLKLNIKPEIMNWVLKLTVVKSPMPLKEDKDLMDPSIDGAILESVYGVCLDWNNPPLAASSVSQLRSTRRIRPFAGTTP